MATHRAWWSLVISEEPNGPHDARIRLSDADWDHIAALVEQRFTEGEIVEDQLEWESAGTSEPGDQHADSVHRVSPDATRAYYSLGPALATPGPDGERWDLALVQINNNTEIARADLGRHADEQTAKDHAKYVERNGQRIETLTPVTFTRPTPSTATGTQTIGRVVRDNPASGGDAP